MIDMSKEKSKYPLDFRGTSTELEEQFQKQLELDRKAVIEQANLMQETKKKEAEDKKKVESMEAESKSKRQRELEQQMWYGETVRHVEIRQRITEIDYDLAHHYDMDIFKQKEYVDKLQKERQSLRMEYVNLHYSLGTRVFSIPKVYVYEGRNGKLMFLEDGQQFKSEDNIMMYTVVRDKDTNRPLRLEAKINNEAIQRFVYDLAPAGIVADMPIVFNPTLPEIKKEEPKIVKVTEKKVEKPIKWKTIKTFNKLTGRIEELTVEDTEEENAKVPEDPKEKKKKLGLF